MDAVAEVKAAWLTSTIGESHKPMFERCRTSGVTLDVNKCAMYRLMHGVGERARGWGNTTKRW